jgi:hypothetical protein
MQKILFFLIIALVFGACATPQSLIHKGDYDGAIRLAVQKLKRSKKDKNVLLLETAFAKAQERDLNRIEFLKKEGQPSSWAEITRLYAGIKNRQNMVTTVTPLRVVAENRPANLKFESVDDAMIDARQNAAGYLYTSAQNLIGIARSNNDRKAARQAFDKLNQIDQYYQNYKDKETLKAQAKDLGISRVFFKMLNSSGMIMPAEFERELLSVYARDLNTNWLQFYTQRQSGMYYDFEIFMNVQTVVVSPEQQREREYIEERDINDGNEPVLDGRGKPKLDSLGRPITRPKIRHVRATILEVSQRKNARVGGQLEFIDGSNGQMIKKVPANADAIFENFAATFKGDREALSPESQQKIGNRPQPFPSNPQLLMNAADRLKGVMKQAVSDHIKMLERM